MPQQLSRGVAGTIRLDAGLVAAAARHTAAGLTVEQLLSTACAALLARLRRLDSAVLAGGIDRAGGEPLPLAPLPDGGVELTVGPLPDQLADGLDARAARFVAMALADPGRPLGELELVDEAEWARLWTWSGRDQPPVDGPVHRLFAAQARRRPDAVAVSTTAPTGERATLSYRELLAHATGIAHELAARGARTGEPVGILLDRGPEYVASMVGVALAGASAVPLDPRYPEPRLRLMLSGPGVRLTLTSAALAGRVPLGDTVPVEKVAPSAEPLAAAEPEVATVMYTSGSTGRPKGVQLTHRGLARLTGDDRLDLGPDDVVLHLAPATFDAALLEVWCPLARGARIALAPPGPLSLSELAEAIVDAKVTVLWLTAGLFHQLAEHQPDCFAGVRRLFTGGDVVSPHQVNAVLSRHPALTVVNGYGPTENTTFTCCHPLRAPLPTTAATVPIGTPVRGTRVFVVDRCGHPVPPGVPGELWAAGDGLAAGYLDLPDQTRERFPVPTAGRLRGVRCYRTGDLVRFRPDGVLEFLGREDSQVKVNGHRIELGEVEQAICALTSVREACVLVETDPLGGKRLAAHLVGDDPRLAREVRAALREALPAYLLPARYLVTDRLPLTANGKIDRVRLGAGESESP